MGAFVGDGRHHPALAVAPADPADAGRLPERRPCPVGQHDQIRPDRGGTRNRDGQRRPALPGDAVHAIRPQGDARVPARGRESGPEHGGFDHDRERVPVRLEGQVGRPDGIVRPAVRDHHPPDRLRAWRHAVPDAERGQHGDGGGRERVSPHVRRRTGERRIVDGDRDGRAERAPDGERQGQGRGTAARDDRAPGRRKRARPRKRHPPRLTTADGSVKQRPCPRSRLAEGRPGPARQPRPAPTFRSGSARRAPPLVNGGGSFIAGARGRTVPGRSEARKGMSQAVAELLEVLDLEPLEQNLFRGRSPQTNWQRVFGGQVIGQALVAACRTVENRQPHSLHGYFLIGGDPKVPIIYEVDRIRDGRSFATRRVVAVQHGRAIFALTASFQVEEDGFDHGLPMPEVPPPEDLPSEEEIRTSILPFMPEAVRAYYERERPIELRPVDFGRPVLGPDSPGRFHVWIRTTGPLPDDPALHRCALAYASDLTLLDTSLVPHGRSVLEGSVQAASLDHALWFHRPFRADEWLLYAQDTPSASGGRGFARGLIFDRGGTLVASVAQEGVIRERRKPDA